VEVQGKERTLIFDTGAPDLFLDASVVGIDPSDLESDGPWTQASAVKAKQLKMTEQKVEFRFAGRRFRINAAILDCRHISEISGKKVEGIIGVIVFEQFKRVTIDFEKSRIELW